VVKEEGKMFDAAIKVLLREELKFVDPPASLSAAIRVLEAAAKVDKKRVLELATAIAHDPFYYYSYIEDSDSIKETGEAIRALLAALPDAPKEEK
jgi:hypothetical protein